MGVDYFLNLTRRVLEEIHYSLKLVNFEEGQSVIQKGTVAESIIFIVSGSLELYVEGSINDYSLDILKPGSVLGAYSIVTETKYEFSARAQSNV